MKQFSGAVLPITSIVLLGAFLALTISVIAYDGLQADERIALVMRDFAPQHSWLRGIMIGFTWAGSIPAMAGLALAGASWNSWKQRWHLAAAWALVPLGGALLNFVLKETINRDRPPAAWRDPIVHETNESFPSGHSMGSMVGFGVAGYAVWLSSWRQSRKRLAITGLALLILGVGFSRIFLRAHWLTDVVGGFSIGLAWLLLCLWWLESWRQRQASQ